MSLSKNSIWSELGFDGVAPEATGRPSYHPSILLKLYIYGYLNRVQSSRRLEHEAGRNVEVMWLMGRLYPITRRLPTSAKTMGLPSAKSGSIYRTMPRDRPADASQRRD